MNYIFISPNYPGGHWRYVAALRQAGHNVYGIGDAGSETFPAELRGNLCDYYRVGDLHNYEEVYKACCYFISRYGRFGSVDSLNPYWCDLVSAVRHDFIENRTSPEEQYDHIRKKCMFDDDVPHIFAAGDSDTAAGYADMLGGYPVLLIPSHDKRLGVRRVENEEDLRIIIDSTEEGSWHIRRYAEGEPLSVDCLCDCREPDLPFPTTELYPLVWGIHVFGGDGCVWSLPITDNSTEQLAQNVLPLFFADRTGLVFFHADCVKLKKAVKGLGKKGDIVLNEWWQAPPHEMVLDCMNIEYDCDLRGIWAMNEAPETLPEQICMAGIASRSFERSYKNSHEKIMRRLAGKLKAHSRTGGFDVGTFLDYYYVFSGSDTADIKRNIKFITEDHAPEPRVNEDSIKIPAAAAAAADSAPRDEAPEDPKESAPDYGTVFMGSLEELVSELDCVSKKQQEPVQDLTRGSASSEDSPDTLLPEETAPEQPATDKKRTKKVENADN